MNEIVRGVITNLDDFVELDKPSGLAFDTKVLILPIEDGKVGGFEPWMVEFMNDPAEFDADGLPDDLYFRWDSSGQPTFQDWAEFVIAAAISRLFEEVESED